MKKDIELSQQRFDTWQWYMETLEVAQQLL
jgi:hypothetical protein